MPRLSVSLAALPLLLGCLFVLPRFSVAQQGTTLAVETFPGADLGARLLAADAALVGRPGTLTVNAAGALSSPVTLRAGHGLLLRAPITWLAPVTLLGGNNIACEGAGASVQAAMPAFHFPAPGGALLLAKGVSGITVRGCTIRSDQTSMLLAGSGVSGLLMEGNTLLGLSLAVVWDAPSTGLTFTGNTVTFPVQRHSDIAAVSLYSARQVTATGNHFTRSLHGVQWWGGDSGAPGANLEQVTTTGEMRFTGNVCAEVGSCIWGSMGYSISITGNSAAGCGDVCFDTEGGRDTEISGNTASGCANGCAAIFFFTRNTAMRNNHFTGPAGGGLIFVKNASQDPLRHQGLVVSGNTLDCGAAVCRAVYAEAVSGLRFENNQVSNGTFLPVNYMRAVTIAGNRMRFTAPLPGGAPAVAAPAVIGGTTLLVTGNTIESEVAQAPGTVCLVGGWSDFNSTDIHILAGNRCGGTHPFPVGILTTTDGKNPGPRAFWILAGNIGGQGPIHHAVTQNEVYRDLPGCPGGVCPANPGSIPRAPCSGANFGQVLPLSRGGGAAVCANNDAGAFVWIAVPGAR